MVAMIALAVNPCIAATMPSVGNPPPELALPNLQNETVNIADFAGKPVILTFFTSWSKSCSEELAVLNKIYNEYKKQGLKVVAVSFDRKTKVVDEFAKENKLDFELLIDKKLKSLDNYAILIIPTTFVIDREGKLANIYVDFDENVERSIREFVENQVGNN